MAGKSGRRRPSAKLTDLVGRAADTAAHLGDRAAKAVLSTIDIAAETILPIGTTGSDQAPTVRRRSAATGGATQNVLKAAAKTNRKLAHTKTKGSEETATLSKSKRAIKDPARGPSRRIARKG